MKIVILLLVIVAIVAILDYTLEKQNQTAVFFTDTGNVVDNYLECKALHEDTINFVECRYGECVCG